MTKLCPRGKAAAKRKFKVYPSAYANAYASKICAGKIKDPSGVKRKDFKGPKPMNKGGGVDAGQKQNVKDSINAVESRKKTKKTHAGIAKFNKGAMMKAKKGKAIMILIGIGKKKKVDKKMMGGMPTAGAMSGMGRLQKAQMNKGGDLEKAKDMLGPTGLEKRIEEARKARSELMVSQSEMQERSGREKARKVKKKLKNISNQVKGFGKEMLGFDKGGGADYMNTVKPRKRGNPAVMSSKQKSLKEKNKLSVGGMSRGGGAAIRGTNFKGVF
jgi:hypothetical protein